MTDIVCGCCGTGAGGPYVGVSIKRDTDEVEIEGEVADDAHRLSVFCVQCANMEKEVARFTGGKALFRIEELLKTWTGDQAEKEIIAILKEASGVELNHVLQTLDLHKLLSDVDNTWMAKRLLGLGKDDNRTALLHLLVEERFEELTLRAKRRLVLAWMKKALQELGSAPPVPPALGEELAGLTASLLQMCGLKAPPTGSITWTAYSEETIWHNSRVDMRKASTAMTGAVASQLLLLCEGTTKAAVDSLLCDLRLLDFQFMTVNGRPNHWRLENWTSKKKNIAGIATNFIEWVAGKSAFAMPVNVPLLLPLSETLGFYPTKDNKYLFVFLNVYNPNDCKAFLKTRDDYNINSRPDFTAFCLAHSAEELEEKLGYFATTVRTPEEWATLSHTPDNAQPVKITLLDGPTITRPLQRPPSSHGTPLPLAGLKVLDFSKVVAAPYCARMLAELGADVVSIRDPHGARSAQLDEYACVGKLSCFADLRTEAARAQVLRLLTQADVVITNSPSIEALEKLGIGPATHVDQRPPFVHMNVTAYRPEGPWGSKLRKAYAPMVAAATGLFTQALSPQEFQRIIDAGYMSAWPFDGFPEDYWAGIMGCMGILGALERRATEGGSFLVQTSLEGALTWASNLIVSNPAEHHVDVPSPAYLQAVQDHSDLQVAGNGVTFTSIRCPITINGFGTPHLKYTTPHKFGEVDLDHVWI